MRIGIDFDGVISDMKTIRRKFILENTGIDIPLGLTKERFIEEFFTARYNAGIGKAMRDATRFITSGTSYMFKGGVEPGCVEVLAQLKADGHRIVIITARYKHEAALIPQFLRQHAVPYNHLIYIQEGERYTKDLVMKRLKIGCLLDDLSGHLNEMAGSGAIPFLLDQPYNQAEALGPGVVRVRSWVDFYDRFKQFQRQGILKG